MNFAKDQLLKKIFSSLIFKFIASIFKLINTFRNTGHYQNLSIQNSPSHLLYCL